MSLSLQIFHKGCQLKLNHTDKSNKKVSTHYKIYYYILL